MNAWNPHLKFQGIHREVETCLKPQSRLFVQLDTVIILLLMIVTSITRPTFAQCPWSKELTELHTECFCAYNNKIQKLSIQCTTANFSNLMNALHESVTDTAIDLFYVNNASLPTIPQGSFKEMDIEELHITKSQVKNISRDAFAGLENKLVRLSLRDNFIEHIPVEAISRLKALQVLDISNNLIATVPSEAFRHMQLATLKLGDNRLSEVAQFAFRGLEPYLKNLNLKNTSLSRIPASVQNLTSLAFLDLSYNKIQQIEPYFMRNMQTLTALSLERNQIEFLNATSFVGVNGSLSSLSFLNNSFRIFPSEAIAQLKEIRVLDFGFNEIEEIPEDAFRQNNLLTLLALDGNPISTLHFETFQHLNFTLRGLRIGGKSLTCDCKLKWILEWIKSYNLQVTSRERNPQFCGKPESLKRKTFWQMSSEEFVCENSSRATLDPQSTTKGAKKLTNLFELKAREEKRLMDENQVSSTEESKKAAMNVSTSDTPLESTVSTVTELRFPIHSLALTSKPSVDGSKHIQTTKEVKLKIVKAYRKDASLTLEWESNLSDNLGVQVIYRFFGSKEFKKGNVLNPSQNKYTISHLPSGECIVVCVLTVKEAQNIRAEDIPSHRCREIRNDRQRALELEKVVIAATVVVCAFILVAIIVFSCCCYRSDKKKLLPPLPPPLPPSMKADNEWETVSMYSARSIPRARMYHIDPNMNGIHNPALDDTRSHMSHYSHIPNNYSKNRSQQSPKAYSQLSSRFSNQNGTLQHHKSNPNLNGAYLTNNHSNTSKKKANKGHDQRLNSTSSLHSLTEYDSDPWNNATIIEPKLENWKDNEVDIYVGQNHVVPSHRHLNRR
ncbi:uncharacterized protein B4U79_01184 [Dinothrombium tinctorium]|uniref:Uncharacterized protein n=1 Tax=Dinothrombium tinctorium TaxID=1965070 RepID=A0A443RBW5_9ACAR|nr:uncharacterized protein B4U79_01184 [Dinothrombium tinctorium]